MNPQKSSDAQAHPNPPVPPASADAPVAATAGRRRWLMAGVAGTAALAGAGVAWWRFQPHAMANGADEALWALQLETPTGAPLALASFKGRPLLLNFWATWCPPCVEELPLLNRFYAERSAQGWQVLGLAIDQPSLVRKFLERTPLDFPIAMAGLGGTDISRSLGNLTGGLPFTVVLGARGQVLHRKMGKITPEDLQQWVSLR